MPTIKKADGTVTSNAAVLREFFGLQPGQTLQGFIKECGELGDAGKSELAVLAAVPLGYTVEA